MQIKWDKPKLKIMQVEWDGGNICLLISYERIKKNEKLH